jgi:hypothetical protein
MLVRRYWLLLALVAAGHGLTSVFHTDPVKAQWSGWTPAQQPYNYVSEIVTLNADSLGLPGYCELFSGQGGGAEFQVNVYSYPNGVISLASGHRTEVRNDVWVRCTLDVAYPESLVKGRRYEFHWSRANGARIQYYYNYCATEYDSMIVPGEDQPPPQPLRPALAMRCFGRLNSITPEWWSIVPGCPWDSSGWLSTWRERMETLAVKRADFSIYWNEIETLPGSYNFAPGGHDIRAHQLHGLLGCVLDARPQLCPDWASSRVETSGETCHYCAPRNLDSTGNANYWARFIKQVIQHYDDDSLHDLHDTIHVWTGWNEPNDTCTDPSLPNTGWWRRPNMPGVYDSLGPGARPLCSLYVRLCEVTESVIHHSGLTDHVNDKFLIGSTSRVHAADSGVVRGWRSTV